MAGTIEYAELSSLIPTLPASTSSLTKGDGLSSPISYNAASAAMLLTAAVFLVPTGWKEQTTWARTGSKEPLMTNGRRQAAAITISGSPRILASPESWTKAENISKTIKLSTFQSRSSLKVCSPYQRTATSAKTVRSSQPVECSGQLNL